MSMAGLGHVQGMMIMYKSYVVDAVMVREAHQHRVSANPLVKRMRSA
jgi:hypothetical protein